MGLLRFERLVDLGKRVFTYVAWEFIRIDPFDFDKLKIVMHHL
jgi:hypothetical protein